MTKKLQTELFERIDAGKVRDGITGANANILGKAYEKQVDVAIAQWARGPELMISTKRMDSSFGKNALNRIEESYGDAKNLRGRHPLAATGFLFVMRSTAFDKERDTALRLMDLLEKLAQGPDAYDATGIIITEWQDPLRRSGHRGGRGQGSRGRGLPPARPHSRRPVPGPVPFQDDLLRTQQDTDQSALRGSHAQRPAGARRGGGHRSDRHRS